MSDPFYINVRARTNVVARMVQAIRFEELGLNERILLIRAFDHDIDDEGFILDPFGLKINSSEIPHKYLRIEEPMLAPGSLEILDGTPTSISKYLRERVEAPAIP